MNIDVEYLHQLGEAQLKKPVLLTGTDTRLLTKVGSKGSLIHSAVAINVGVCPATRIEIYLKTPDQTMILYTAKTMPASTGISNTVLLLEQGRLSAGCELWVKSTVAVPLGITIEINGRHIGNPPFYTYTGSITAISRRATSSGVLQ